MRRSRRVADGGTVRLVPCCIVAIIRFCSGGFAAFVHGLQSAGYVRAVPQPLPRNHRLREQALDAAKLDRIVAEANELEPRSQAGATSGGGPSAAERIRWLCRVIRAA